MTTTKTAALSIDLHDVVKHGGIEQAIHALCEESDTTSSGVIGPSFSTSGPGSGWSMQHDASDYSVRSFEGGALHYIDAADGKMRSALTAEDADYATRYHIRDGSANETADTLEEAIEMVSNWYDYMAEGEGDNAYDLPDGLPVFDDHDITTVEELNDRIATWENAIAEVCGVQHFAGHGNYEVAARDRMGLRLSVEAKNDGDLPDDVHSDIGGGLYRIGDWSDDSVVELICPDLDDAVEHPEQVAEMAKAVISTHGAESDKAEWKKLVVSIQEAAEALSDVDADDLD